MVKVRFELTPGTVWRCCTTIMLLYHMLTHSAPLTTLFLSIQDAPGSSPVDLLGCLYLSIQIESVLAYGRGTGNRTLIDRLKAGYSSLWIIPPYGPSGQTWTANQRIKSPLRYHCATKGWIVNIFFYVPSKTIRGSKMTLTFTWTFHVILLCWYYAFGLGVLTSRTLVSNLLNASTIVEALLSYLFWHLPLQSP